MENEMPKVKIIRATVVSGQSVDRGDTPDVSERDARILISMGKAELVGSGETATRTKSADPKKSAGADK